MRITTTTAAIALTFASITNPSPVQARTGALILGQTANLYGETPEADLARMLDAIVEQDSRSWWFNRYDSGSMTNAQFLTLSSDGQNFTAYGEYRFNGGSQGWVKAQFRGGAIACVEYWDFEGTCRAVGDTSYGSALIALGLGAAAAAAMAGGGSGSADYSSGSSSAYDPYYDDPQPRYTPPAPPPPPPPQEPVGGWNGLYGCASPPCW